MTALPALLERPTGRESGPLRNTVAFPSPGVSAEALTIDRALKDMRVWRPSAFVGDSETSTEAANEVAVFEARLRAKLLVANVAMHIKTEWRESLFRQLDDILDVNEWDVDDAFPTAGSMRTFLRMIIYLKFKKCPGLGISGGNVVAAWTREDHRLTIESLSEDRTQWVYSRQLDDLIEIGSGLTTVTRLPEVLSPYIQGASWIFHGEAKSWR